MGEQATIQPEQIQDIHWTTVSDQLQSIKSRRLTASKGRTTSYIRKPAECMRRYTKLRGAAKGGAEKAGASRGPWTAAEDGKIMKLVQLNGPKRWSHIASELPGECFAF